ncbi:hypothetical protein Cgig2_024760 [Carnegiea gigantea]|uniref:Uncharacterized protein n=1 Tax=Carnegiea gigantea TaxID=171969 RepID=A0A9Q1Q9H5_9CARY|nr:hypothetical protein Cgig2_024760 [Carnegiea gigantea]
MEFASFLKVDLKQNHGKFSKWLIESFDPYAKFPITALDVHVTLGVPFSETQIVEFTESSMDEEYDEVSAAWLREWKINQNAPELTRMPEFVLAKKDEGESFKRDFITYLNHYCSNSVLKYVKDVNRIALLDWCQFVLDKLISSVRHYKKTKDAKDMHFNDKHDGGPSFSPILTFNEPDTEAEDSTTTSTKMQELVLRRKTIVKKETNKDDRISSFGLIKLTG